MPFKLTIYTRLPDETDGGVRRPMGVEETHLYFHDKTQANKTAEANTSSIQSCEVRFVEQAPGPFADEPRK